MADGGKRIIIIIAGPNGTGKPTFAREFLPNEAQCHVFVNADLIRARRESRPTLAGKTSQMVGQDSVEP